MYCPHYSEIIPFVKIIPEDFFYGTEGNQNTWESLGDWESKLLNG